MLAILLLTTLASAGHDETIPPADLPAAITKTLEARYPGAKILKAEREQKKGQVEYEVKACHDGRKIEAEFDDAGDVKEVETKGPC